METLTDYGYAYASASAINKTDLKSSLLLSHQTELEEVNNIPCFFWGRLREPYLAARCLMTVAKTVRSRFALSMQELMALRDPIVTAGAGQVRFEGFSSCNGVYARLDILPEGLDGEFLASGTTNVDFNEPMINALNGITKTEDMVLSVGQKSVTVITEKTKVVERKVTLPNRWIKGLTSVQHYLADMQPIFTLTKAQALQLFQSLPKGGLKADVFIVQRAGKFLFSPLQQGQVVRIGGAHRLRLMEGLLPFLDSLSIYQSADGQAAGFVLMLGAQQLVFAFSGDAYRGFSGEGKALEHLIDDLPLELVYGFSNLLKANEAFNPTLLSIEHDIDFDNMNTLTAQLSSIGLLGFDLVGNQHFYRRLPFKTQRILSLNPRLKNARKLVADNDIQIVAQKMGYVEARVKGSDDAFHTVIIENEQSRCTCDWFMNHQTKRGLCKHILAVKMRE
ncbi:SWIM zinc finger family protein [Spirosoma sp. HMF3257]|uniref:SWIM zinc finger family protein n=1 Tax=Spirosoma telluris TaxID=2183553 RepID=A0A327NEA1_9BACT|nr:SWIM zinc finger family protein [Spirosoma telluris]RAI73630.1 SWIM zinc finger family protein [Spirosoma telluris]